MDINGGFTTFLHRKSPSSDRLLRKLSLSSASSSDFEFTEADLFFTNGGLTDSSTSPENNTIAKRNNKLGFRMQETSGILAALPGDRATTAFRSIPKPQRGISSSDSSELKRVQQHSAPVNVPSMMKKAKKFGQLSERENTKDEEEEMLPPHEIVAMKLKSTSSVLEGVGRTLKGRDLRQVRNAVWRQTGFLD